MMILDGLELLIILGNISELKNYFEESQVSKMKDMIIEDH